MPRYIDADKFAERIKVSPAFPNMGFEGHFLRNIVLDLLDNAPTADVAPKSEVALEAIDDFQNTLRHIFLAMCDGNDYNNLNLLQIDSAIEALFDSKIAELKKKYTEEKE